MTDEMVLILRVLLGGMMELGSSFYIPGTYFTPIQFAFGCAFIPMALMIVKKFVGFGFGRILSLDSKADKVSSRSRGGKGDSDE